MPTVVNISLSLSCGKKPEKKTYMANTEIHNVEKTAKFPPIRISPVSLPLTSPYNIMVQPLTLSDKHFGNATVII